MDKIKTSQAQLWAQHGISLKEGVSWCQLQRMIQFEAMNCRGHEQNSGRRNRAKNTCFRLDWSHA